MDTRPLEGNALSGSTQKFHYDELDDTVRLEEIEDVQPLIELNTALRNETVRDRFGGEMHRIASIPMSIYAELVRKGITRDPARFKAWLNDRDNRAFRTHEALV